MIFKEEELVDVLDKAAPKLFRKAIVVEAKTSTCLIQFMDTNDYTTFEYPINKIKKIRKIT